MQDENVSKKQAKPSLGKGKALRGLLAFVFPFFIGFFVHAYLFPDLLPQTMTSYAKKAIGIQEVPLSEAPQKQDGNTDDLIKQVTYLDGKFSPSVVRVHYGNYISIRNIGTSKDDLMWLTSDSSELRTDRGYAESEQLQKTLVNEGTFTVSNKLRPDARLTVIVYK